MKNILMLGLLFALPVLFTSCLKKDLPAANNSSLNNITDFYLVYKYADTIVDNKGTTNENERTVVQTVKLDRKISISHDTVYVTPVFPAGFPQKEKVKVKLTNIWGVVNVPDAAIVHPVDGAPKLGTPGDFSAPVSYEVTAANGNKTRWVISVSPLPVVNQWEGMYAESGTLNHASAGLQTCPANYTQELITASANSIKATAGYWYFSNPGITYFITINPDNSVTISADPDAVVSIQQDPAQASTYDPLSKKFNLYYYYYSGGNPANWRKFHTVFTLK
ncbi:DUF4361 domain-containing protein [Danxiaibacter flavus]|uniref:DUF4361 domain-containing protein n=1 Tax=Danxiaibacter flavus TaxID=3049108 RepID=A0ABV3ZGX9_9BACT|nr:DUF4361 domain-containing protein [Chitinophagaceae bacterium DXS]